MSQIKWTSAALLIVAAMLLLLAGCAQAPAAEPASEPPVAAATEGAPAQPAAPAEEKVLRIAVQAAFDDLSPLRGGGPTAWWTGMWWASPMYFDAAGELQPYVFTDWKSNDDYTVWTFTIDPRAVFSDGSPITAEDVKGTWDLCAVPTTRHQRVGNFFSGVVGYDEVTGSTATQMSGIVAKDPSTVEVTLSSPDPVFYQRVASSFISPVKASQAVGEDGQEVFEWWKPENGVVSSGPWMPESMDLNKSEAVYVRNPNFWMGTPVIDRVIMTAVEDPDTAITLFKNGELDAMNELFTPTLVAELGEEFVSGPLVPRGHQFWIDSTKPPFDDINVRKALIMSIDPVGVVQAAFPQGPGQAVRTLLDAIPGLEAGYDYYTPDPEAAKAALAASSYGSAENLPTIYFVGISSASHELAAQYVAEQWRQILGIQSVEMKGGMDEYSGPDQGRIQIFRDDTGSQFPDAISYLKGTAHSSSGNAQGKMGGYTNTEVDRMLDEGAMIPADDPQRNEMALEAQRLFFEDFMFIPYYNQNMPRIAMEWVLNWSKNMDWQVVEPWNVDLAEH